MSMEQASVGVPEFDLADRMRKALRHSGVSVHEMAEYLGVARNTVSTWINGRIEPSTQTQRLWALKTGVPYEWLHDGISGNSPSPTNGITNRCSGESDAACDASVTNFRVHSSSQRKPGAMRTTRTAA